MTPIYIEKAGDVEGFGIVYLEANAFGKSVIASRSGGITEAVVDNYSGLLVESGNINEIKEAILDLIKNEDKAKRLGQQGLARVIEEFDWAKRADILEKICDEIASSALRASSQ